MISMELEGIGNLRVAYISREFVYCFTDVCRLLDIPSNHKVRSYLNADGIYNIDSEEENRRHKKLMFIDLKNVNELFKLSSTNSRTDLVASWFASEVFPMSLKNDEYSFESLEDPAVRMQFIHDYEEAMLENIQHQNREKRDKVYIDSMMGLFGNRRHMALNEYFSEIFARNIPKGIFYSLLYKAGVMSEDHLLNQQFIDSGHFLKVISTSLIADRKVTIEVVFITKKGINFVEKLIEKHKKEISDGTGDGS